MNRSIDGSASIARLRAATPTILPSVLLCDFGNLEREIRRLEQAGVAALHLDVMDGHFVPNLSFGMAVVEAIRRLTDLILDVHLMISEPERYVEAFVEAGADVVTFHIEAVADPFTLIEKIHSLRAAAGVALKPGTPIESIEPCLGDCDLALVMSVEPGFGGQPFDPSALPKLRALRGRSRSGPLLEIDGGVNRETIGDCVAAGAQALVVGSAITKAADYAAAVHELSEQIGAAGRR
jgi:ribulose-phosphate 3-epimerase